MAKALVLIDGANMHAMCKALNISVDYNAFYTYLYKKGPWDFFRPNYYTALSDSYPGIYKLVTFLKSNNYHVITKKAKIYFKEDGSSTVKGNMDIEIATDAMDMINKGLSDVYLVSGDGDFTYLAETLKRNCIRVHVIATAVTHPPMVDTKLRQMADEFIELASVYKNFQLRT